MPQQNVETRVTGLGPLLAVPALSPDVAVIHAWRADRHGNVQFPWPPDHLADVDLLLARAARTVVVTAERIVDSAVIAAAAERTTLLSFEVDAGVSAPRGAAPTASPPDHGLDRAGFASAVSPMMSVSEGCRASRSRGTE